MKQYTIIYLWQDKFDMHCSVEAGAGVPENLDGNCIQVFLQKEVGFAIF